MGGSFTISLKAHCKNERRICQLHGRFFQVLEIYFFEPSVSNMETAVKRTSTLRDIFWYQVGLSDCEGELLFNYQE